MGVGKLSDAVYTSAKPYTHRNSMVTTDSGDVTWT
jgi:hypothetical protein